MSGLQVYCSKGCGVAITVSDEAVKEASNLGVPMNVAHEVCPRDAEHFPIYRVVTSVTRHDWDESKGDYSEHGERLTQIGGKASAPTFVDAFDEITTVLGEQLENVSKMKHVIEENFHN